MDLRLKPDRVPVNDYVVGRIIRSEPLRERLREMLVEPEEAGEIIGVVLRDMGIYLADYNNCLLIDGLIPEYLDSLKEFHDLTRTRRRQRMLNQQRRGPKDV